jgi:hypothetical protein
MRVSTKHQVDRRDLLLPLVSIQGLEASDSNGDFGCAITGPCSLGATPENVSRQVPDGVQVFFNRWLIS